MHLMLDSVDEHLTRRPAWRLEIEAVVFTNERGILGITRGAARLLERIADNP